MFWRMLCQKQDPSGGVNSPMVRLSPRFSIHFCNDKDESAISAIIEELSAIIKKFY